MTAPRRDDALREQGDGANQKTLKRVKNTSFPASKQAKTQPANGAIGDAFYSKMFGKAGAK